jgi:hypothetical protein
MYSYVLQRGGTKYDMESVREHQNAGGEILQALSTALRIIKSTTSQVAPLVPFLFISPSASLLIEAVNPRTLEENVLLFQTRSQDVRSLSTIVGLQVNVNLWQADLKILSILVSIPCFRASAIHFIHVSDE